MTVDIAGQRFGKLVAISTIPHPKTGRRMWLLRCDCGGETAAFAGAVRAGQHKGCKCSLSRPTHGLRSTRQYSIWQSMKYRCNNPKHVSYHRYGGRGISVSPEWDQFEPFYVWAMVNGYSEELQLDRRNNDGNYSPENCRFVTPKENVNNRSCSSH